VIGQVTSAALAGAVAGPAVGALASLSRPALFCALALAAFTIAGVSWRMRIELPVTIEPHADLTPRQAVGRLLGHPVGLGAIWLMVLPAVAAGLLTVLGSLRLHVLGAGAVGIAASFLGAAVLETLVSTWVGRLSDRRGRLLPLACAVGGAGVTMLCFTFAASLGVLIAVIGGTALALGAAWSPAMTLLSDVGEAIGLDQGLAAGLMNTAWSIGQIIGTAGSGALAHLAGNGVPSSVVAALCAATVIVLFRARHSLGIGSVASSRQDASPCV
jgi:MFS family permease